MTKRYSSALRDLPSTECSSCHIRTCAPFVFCQSDELELISSNKTCQRYGKGQAIFREGSPASGLYCIQIGKIKVIKIGGDEKEQIIHLGKEGDVLGLGALITNTSYSTSAVALEDSVVCHIPRNTFLYLLTSNTQFCTALMKLLADSLRQAEQGMLHLAYKPVRERLADALLLLARTYHSSDQTQVSVTISREDLAALVGTAKETTIRLLSELKDGGIIASKGSQITILKLEKLVDIAALYS